MTKNRVTLADRPMIENVPQVGLVRWIGLRPALREAMHVVDSAKATIENGLIGDRFAGKPGAARQVTLIQHEHIIAVAAMLQLDTIDPGLLRRNIAVSGVNLLALKNREFQIGSVIFKGTGICSPCSRMEDNLGPGGYNTMRGHGGMTASVVQSGVIAVGDDVTAK